ncbi:MAG: lipase [Flavobacteriales bacterium]|nr:MAG: lipase [Flavobacteriales bacterium]
MKHLLLFIISLFTVLWLTAQEKSTHTYAIKGNDTLRLDIYTDKTIKKGHAKPVLLWMHGGGFSGGTRDNPAEVKLAEFAAKRGYIGVSISYRLTRKDSLTGFGCDALASEKLRTFKMAVEDYMDAALFVVNNAKKFNIDTDKIIAGGSSAGAETVLNAVFMRPFFITNLTQYQKVRFRGLISLAGAMVNANYITAKNAVPSVFFHGTADNLVPYATAPHHCCKPEQPGYFILDGAETIIKKFDELNTPYYFYTVIGGMHEVSGIPFYDLENIFSFFEQSFKNDKSIQQKIYVDKK